jgi:pyruvate/2-oxoglutarate/acetoin dehydrogenase E1 component
MRNWILENSLAEEPELLDIEMNAKQMVKESKQRAWEKYLSPLKQQVQVGSRLMKELAKNVTSENGSIIIKMAEELEASKEPLRRDLMKCLATCLDIAGNNNAANGVRNYYDELAAKNAGLYNTLLYNEGPKSALKVKEIKPVFNDESKTVNGYEVLNKYFDQLFESNDKVIAFGEDVGLIGDVNQGFSGLQEKHGKQRIFDTGIRELSIVGQGIGLALRGLRPIAEIQYLDYILYGLQTLSDDCATTHYRTAGGQSCPLIVRTRGHRLEGIWHSGSPMGMIINSLRGMYICVPRNMVQAVGMYNTLLQSNDPALMIECLNGYRLKEKLPTNLLTYTVPLGVPEIVKTGMDITLVSYGATLRIVMEAAETLQKMKISCEVIDVQTLLPFDVNHQIVESLKKTNRIIFIDEDVPGGAAAYMFNKVMEEQAGYKYLDISPRTITAKAHRPSYSSDGDYFSKTNTEDVVRIVKEMMAE